MYVILKKNAAAKSYTVGDMSFESTEEMHAVIAAHPEYFKPDEQAGKKALILGKPHKLSALLATIPESRVNLVGSKNDILIHVKPEPLGENLKFISSVGSAIIGELAGALKKKLITEFQKSDTYKDSEFYQMIFPKSNDDKIQEQLKGISADVKEILEKIANLEQRSLEAIFVQNREYLRSEYSSMLTAYRNNLQEPSEAVRNEKMIDFATGLFDSLGDRNRELRKVIIYLENFTSEADLKSCDLPTRLRVLLYANCCMLNLVFLREQLFWASELEYNFGSLKRKVAADGLKEDLNNFLSGYATKTGKFMSSLIQGRIGKISDSVSVRSYSEERAITIDGRTQYRTIWWVNGQWKDDFSSGRGNDPFIGNTINDSETVGARNSNDQDRINEVRNRLTQRYNDHRAKVEEKVATEVTNPLTDALNAMKEFNSGAYNPAYLTTRFSDLWYRGGEFCAHQQGGNPFFANSLINSYTYFFSDPTTKALYLISGLLQMQLFTTTYDHIEVLFDANAKAFLVFEKKLFGTGWRINPDGTITDTFKYTTVGEPKTYAFERLPAGNVYEYRRDKTVLRVEETTDASGRPDIRMMIYTVK